jgi:hypothetical protein
MTAKPLAGWFAFWTLWFHVLAVVVPMVAGPVQAEVAPMDCPRIVVAHGVGSDLKTWARERDNCSGFEQ